VPTNSVQQFVSFEKRPCRPTALLQSPEPNYTGLSFVADDFLVVRNNGLGLDKKVLVLGISRLFASNYYLIF